MDIHEKDIPITKKIILKVSFVITKSHQLRGSLTTVFGCQISQNSRTGILIQ